MKVLLKPACLLGLVLGALAWLALAASVEARPGGGHSGGHSGGHPGVGHPGGHPGVGHPGGHPGGKVGAGGHPGGKVGHGSKGHVYKGKFYKHNTYAKFGLGWSRRAWYPRLGCWVYWCPPEGCWFTYDAGDETFVPLDNLIDENMSGLQYGP
jgi:hypothetical protein